MRILIVEDDQQGMGEIVQRRLEVLREKFPRAEIVLVGTLADGLRVLATIPHPDVTFLDLGLPDSTWTATLQRVPEIDDMSPVIIITGHAEDKVRELLTRPEVEVIQKTPAMFARLLGAIAAALARRQASNHEKIAANLELLRELTATPDAAQA